jgi:hypothetical protein
VWFDSNPDFGTPSSRHSAMDSRIAGLADGLAEQRHEWCHVELPGGLSLPAEVRSSASDEA